MSQCTATNIMGRGREEHFGGETREKEEAGCPQGKQLGQNRNRVRRDRGAEAGAVPASKPAATDLSDKHPSSPGEDVLRYRC